MRAILLIFLLIPIAHAVGSSTAGYDIPPIEEEGTLDGRINDRDLYPEFIYEPTCEDLDELYDRIECRLDTGDHDETAIPEACRDVPLPQDCNQLYKDSYNCYALDDDQKDACFREKTNYPGTKQNARLYIVLLLYELQERVEAAYDTERISTQDAALLITNIVEAKHALLRQESSLRVQAKINTLQHEYFRVMIQ